MADNLEWHYLDCDAVQKGPATFNELKDAYKNKKLTNESLIWNETMDDWAELSTLSDLLMKLKPTGGPPKRGPPPSNRRPPATHYRGPSASPQQFSPNDLNEGTLEEAKHRAAETIEEEKVATAWKEFLTPEGLVYYHNTDSGQTTWEKPDILKTAEELDKKGEWVWYPDGSEKAYIPTKVVNRFFDGRVELESEEGQRFVVKKKDAGSLEPVVWSSLQRLESDLVMLDKMNRPLIIHNLRQRFLNNEIYTNVGTILISVNPYKLLPLYTPTMIDKYRHRGMRRLPPHVFEIADSAYTMLMDNSKGQAIVISGESGAGKTEATKQCLQFLAEVAGSSTNVEQKILVANPILEGFGNAKTVRNNNSSRFGKYVEIFFDGRGRICGATNTNYLLEKSRVVVQNEGERNFHIFYQLSRGASKQQQTKYKLRPPEEFYYLNQSTTEVDGMDDVHEFKEVMSAFKMLGITDKEVDDIFNVVAGVMHLGNIKFRDVGDRKCEPESKQPVNDSASFFKVTESNLINAITSKIMRMRGQDDVKITLSGQEAANARDALAKFVYEKLFDWLVQRINKAIGTGGQRHESIGILDIFGFEIFKLNSFEQLCINYTNEMLQQYFNQHTFKLEEALYKSEQIRFVHVEYIDNQPVLDLIEKRPKGILPMIDEEIRIPKGSDKTYVNKLLSTHKTTNEFSSVLANPDHFMVKHYAGSVNYDSNGFLEKNKDRLNDDTFDLLQTSTFGFLKSLFPKQTSSEQRLTLSKKFSGQLHNLMAALNLVNPHYIRCIKPNPNKASMEFDGNMVLEQLQYSGVFEAVEIRKTGYPFRLYHEEFVKRFKCIVPKKNFRDYKKGAYELIDIMRQDHDKVQVGTTRVCYRAEQHREMELIRNVAVEKVVILIQSWLRRFLAQIILKRMKAIKPALKRALASCQKSRSIAEIDKAIATAANISPFFVMQEVAELKWLKHVIIEEQKISKQLAELLKLDHEKNYEALSRAVASANEIGLQSPEADKAREIVAFIKEKRAVEAALKAGIEEYDEEKLRLNLEKAQQLGVQENVENAYEMLHALITEKQYLYDNAIYQLQVLEEEQMQDILSRADGIRFTTPEIERMRELLLDTPEEKFVQMQLKAAVANNDPDRAIRVTIRLKDIFFEKSGDMFNFPNFGPLRDPYEWAQLKWFGLSLDKDELAAGMLYWTNKPIHASLMVLDSRSSKTSKNMFKNILGFMGDRQLDGPEVLARELCDICLQQPQIRDEIYCELIKQLTRNPNQGSIARGWQLMAICLETFPPNAELENYLEMYLRNNAPDKNRYIVLLHQAVYGGALMAPPSIDNIRKIASGQPLRQLDIKYTPEEKAAAKEALAFGGQGPQFARPSITHRTDQMSRQGFDSTPKPPSGRRPPAGRMGRMPPAGRGPPPGRPGRRGPPRGSPPAGRGPPPGRRGAPPGRRGPPPGRRGPPAGRPPRGSPAPMRRGPPPSSKRPEMPGRGPPPGRRGRMAPAGRGPPPGRMAPRGAPPRGAPPRGSPPRGSPAPRGFRLPSRGNAAPRGGPAPSSAPNRGFRLPLQSAPRMAPRMGANNNRQSLPKFNAPSRNVPARAAPPRAAPPKKKSAWQIVQHPDTGEDYYWNPETNETSWDKPADF